jgi:hypothetical protein
MIVLVMTEIFLRRTWFPLQIRGTEGCSINYIRAIPDRQAASNSTTARMSKVSGVDPDLNMRQSRSFRWQTKEEAARAPLFVLLTAEAFYHCKRQIITDVAVL